MFRRHLLPWLTLAFYRAWVATWRTTVVHSKAFQAMLDNKRPCVLAHWHRDELAVVRYVGTYRVATLTSNSRDGQLIDFVIRHLGGVTAKGSSSGGGAGGLRALIRLMKAGHCTSMAVDGPRGPIFKAKPGVFELSKLTGAAIIPVGVASQSRIIFEKSWNKARLPKPFSRVVVIFGEPLDVDIRKEPDLHSPQLAERLEASITGTCREAEALGLRAVGGNSARAGGFAPV
ncbi:MAG: hypothetical protein QG602_3926 [Verrucomicrobiota bacterium]|nr:hypothetical protein [Verrucomicrobiota bacterium]